MCPFEIDLKGICSISLQEFRNFKISIGLESRGFLVQKKKKKVKKQRTKQRNDEEEGQEEKEVKGKGEDKKENSHLVCLSIW